MNPNFQILIKTCNWLIVTGKLLTDAYRQCQYSVITITIYPNILNQWRSEGIPCAKKYSYAPCQQKLQSLK